MTCKGPGCGVDWTCTMQHGVVDGRCADCRVMAQAASNLNTAQIDAVRRASLRPTIFGYPVTVSLGMPDGEALVLSDAFRVDPVTASISINTMRVAHLIDTYGLARR